MATGAAPGDGFLRGSLFEGSISGHDLGIERRPYHRNCNCALHKLHDHCGHAPSHSKKVSYPVRRSWSENCLALAAASSSPAPPCSPSPSSSPAVAVAASRSYSNLTTLYREEEEEEEVEEDEFAPSSRKM